MKRLFLLFCVSCSALIMVQGQPITRIAFGSCSEETNPNQLWDDIVKTKPQLWIWLGDIVYADSKPNGQPKGSYASMYAMQKSFPAYQQLLTTCPVIGTWDDHDYGINDGGKFHPKKQESKEALLNFLDIPTNSELRSREGVYNAYTYGEGNRKVKVILLDTRSFRDTLVNSTEKGVRYEINRIGDVLGEAQWRWLENELTDSDAAIHIIGTSIQFIAEEQGFEKWANFPVARERMIALLSKTKPSNTIMISGDRHIAEISKMKIPGWNYELYDFTSSGLTHTWSTVWEEANKYRVGELIIQKNFGLIEIDWKKRKPRLTLTVRGSNQSTYATYQVTF